MATTSEPHADEPHAPHAGVAERAIHDVGNQLLPAWRRVSRGEPRLAATISIVMIMTMQIALPEQVTSRARWALPILEGLLLVGLLAANPKRINRQSMPVRTLSIILIAIISAANGWAAGHLVRGLVNKTMGSNPAHLLTTGGAVWLTNVLIFSLWYWELDRGGPAARANAVRPYPDLLFPQMTDERFASPDWAPAFLDYAYLSFTNATAFSPTDVLPLARWAKLTMAIQSGVSLITVALVIARAVNIL